MYVSLFTERLRGPWTLVFTVLFVIALSTAEGIQLPEYEGNVDFRRENPHSLLRPRQSSGSLGPVAPYERGLLPAEPLQFAASSRVAHSVDSPSDYDYGYDYASSRGEDDPRELEGQSQAGSLSKEDYQSQPDILSSAINDEKSPHSFNQDSAETFHSDYTMDSQETGTSSSFEKDQSVGFRLQTPASSHFTSKLKISKGSVTPTTWRPRFPFSGEETSPFPLFRSKPLFRSQSNVNSRENFDISTFRPTTFRHSFQTQKPSTTSLRTQSSFFHKSTTFPSASHESLRDIKSQPSNLKKEPNAHRTPAPSLIPANARRLPPVRAPFFPRLPPPPPPPPPSPQFPSSSTSSSTEFILNTSKLDDMISEEATDEHSETDEIPEVTEYQKDDENSKDEITELAHVAEHAILGTDSNGEVPTVAEHSGDKEHTETVSEKPLIASTQSPFYLTTASKIINSQDNSLEPSGGSTSIDMVTEIVANFPSSEQKETIISSVQTSKSAEEGLSVQEESVAYSEEEGTADYGAEEDEHKSTDAPSTSITTTKLQGSVSVKTLPSTTPKIDKSHSSESSLIVKSVKTSMSFSRSTSNADISTENAPDMISSEEKVHVATEINADTVPMVSTVTLTSKDSQMELTTSATRSPSVITTVNPTVQTTQASTTASTSASPEMTKIQVIVRTESSFGTNGEVVTSSTMTSTNNDAVKETNTKLTSAEITSMDKSSSATLPSTSVKIPESETKKITSIVTASDSPTSPATEATTARLQKSYFDKKTGRNRTITLIEDPNELAKFLPSSTTMASTKSDNGSGEEKQTQLFFDKNSNKTRMVKIMTEDPSVLAKMTPPPRNSVTPTESTQGSPETQTRIVFNAALGKNLTLRIVTEDPSILAKMLPPPREGQPRSLNADSKSNSLQNVGKEGEKNSTRSSLPSTTTAEPVLLLSIPGVPKQVGKLPIITRHNVTRKPFLMARTTTRNPLPPPTFRKISDILGRNKSLTTRRPSYNRHQYEGNYNEDPDRHSTESPHPTTTTTERTTTTLSPYLKWGQSVLVSGRLKLTDGIEWKENFRDPHSLDFKTLANEVEGQLDKLYKSNQMLNNKYKGVEVDRFSKGSVLVDYTLYLRPNIIGNIEQQLRDAYRKGLNNGTNLGRYKVDPVYADFKVERLKSASVAPTTDDGPLFPHWAIAVVVIGAVSILFLVILAVVMTKCKQAARRKYGTPLTEHILTERSRTWDKDTSNENGRTWDKKQGYDSIRNEGLYGVSDVWNEQKLKPQKPASNSNLYGQQGSLSNSKRPSSHSPYYHNNAFEKEDHYGQFASYSNKGFQATHMPPKYDESWDDGPEPNQATHRYQATHLPPKYDNSWDDELNIYTKGGSRRRDYDTTF